MQELSRRPIRQFHAGHRLAAAVSALLLLFAVMTPADYADGPTGAAPDFLSSATIDAPGDSQECSADNAQLIPEAPPILKSLHADLAWTKSTGKNVVVAVIDSGVAADNEHFNDKAIAQGTNLVNDDGASNGWVDHLGHGTSIAGIIAARAVEGSGVIGLAPEATILPVRVFRDQEEGTVLAGNGPNTLRMAEGIRWAAGKGAQIINVSMSAEEDDPYLTELEEAVVYAAERGALVVASAGNTATAHDASSTSKRYPAAFPQVLGVTAVNEAHVVDESSFHGPQVDIAANGSYVATTFHGGGDCIVGIDGASTSWATAYASAAAALVASMYPQESPASWKHRLMVTASRPAPDRRDDEAGWGLVQPYEALLFIDDGTAPGPPSPDFPPPTRPAALPQDIDLSIAEKPLSRTQSVALVAGLLGFATIMALLLFTRARKGLGKDSRD